MKTHFCYYHAFWWRIRWLHNILKKMCEIGNSLNLLRLMTIFKWYLCRYCVLNTVFIILFSINEHLRISSIDNVWDGVNIATKIMIIGIDSLSIDWNASNETAHKVFFFKSLEIVESQNGFVYCTADDARSFKIYSIIYHEIQWKLIPTASICSTEFRTQAHIVHR